ncbi:DegT/DnrJ/EryC1/StrS family aminotransferase [Fulvivirga sp. M361]|uniref:DegT/DnrJ/EryC1/StrS family aminotransferase n=1 Tax=Fulvivirga sp. M361 TaxID=2594266 RepID=UPI00117B7E31|nr:DegT/DnrJ/EryC1/StrS family aminotransferase [Fulvivirga sp. M361]TRX50950.1 DegT/DnrJ/EryC1/StrS family aminotransferase [Fulvivirga sp. M361]
MKIPFVDLTSQYHTIKKEVDEAISKVLEGGVFIGGKPVEAFEKCFQNLYDTKHCIGVGSGTDAIYITLKMLGIGPGDEVITAANGWISTAAAVTQTGATPVFVDIDPSTYTINVNLIPKALSSRTRAILPVHLYGQSAHIRKISEICEAHNLFLVEDCAQAHLTEENRVKAGTFGNAGIFSFYPVKNLGSYGNAGCIITEDDHLATEIRTFANNGALKKHHHTMEGINSQLDTLQAAVLNVKSKYIEQWNAQRIKNAALYASLLSETDQIHLPTVRKDTRHTFHLYVIRTKRRDALKEYLEEAGIQTAIHYPVALPNLPAYRHLNTKPSDFPVATQYQNEILSLPIYPEMTEDMIYLIIEKIKSFFGK